MMDDARTDQSMRGATAPRRGTNGHASPITDADEFFRSLDRARGAVTSYLRSQVVCTPYLALGGGFLAGYVLGAGIPPRIAAFLLSMAGRNVLNELISGTLATTTRPTQG